MTKPSFNEYVTQYYHQLISASEDGANRADAKREAVEQAVSAVIAKACYPPEIALAAGAEIDGYDDTQGRSADKVLATLANGTVDLPTGMGAAEIKRTIAVLGKGRRKLVGALKASDLAFMVENRTTNYAKAGSALVTFSENVQMVTPSIIAHGTIAAAIDAGEFRTDTASDRDNEREFTLPTTNGKRVIARKKPAA